MKFRAMVVFGTRPEAIKMAPVILALQKDDRFRTIVVNTGQHQQMVDQVLEVFGITPDFNLRIMVEGQTLNQITCGVLDRLDPVLTSARSRPDVVLVHGDTTTAFAAALAAFYQKIPVGHVEAGLRSGDKFSPYPEEMNRILIDDLANIHFAPTELNRANLLKEGHAGEYIFVTGNTVVDAMKYTVADSYKSRWLKDGMCNVLLTMHRRENWGRPMASVFRAVNRLVADFKDLNVIFPMHLNAKVREIAREYLVASDRVQLVEPFGVFDMHNVLERCSFAMTDSGGIQEEAVSLGVPVLVLRDTTERGEGVESGILQLVGTAEQSVYDAAKRLLTDAFLDARTGKGAEIYGNGKASQRIVEGLYDSLLKVAS